MSRIQLHTLNFLTVKKQKKEMKNEGEKKKKKRFKP